MPHFSRNLLLERLEDRWNPAGHSFIEPQVLPGYSGDGLVFVAKELVGSIPEEEYSGSQVFIIDGAKDVISQMTAGFVMHGKTNLIRVISHGWDGGLWFGEQEVNINTLNQNREMLIGWRNLIHVNSIFALYGCNIALTGKGKNFVDIFSKLSGAYFVASVNQTGSGGDLTFEYKTCDKQVECLSSERLWKEDNVCLEFKNIKKIEFTANAGNTFTLLSDISGTKTYSIKTGLLPSGLFLDSATGTISGNPIVPTNAPINLVVEATSPAGTDISNLEIRIKSYSTPGEEANSGSPLTGRGFTNYWAFASLTVDGGIKAWGKAEFGGSNAPNDFGYKQIFSTERAFAGLKEDGTIKSWGDGNSGGTGAPTSSGFVDIFSTPFAFAARKSDGTIASWGMADYGGSGAPAGSGFRRIYSSGGAFSAIDANGKIVSWGNRDFGGTGAPAGVGYSEIISTYGAFAALKDDGSIFTWGDAASGNSGSPAGIGFVRIYSTYNGGFAALKNDGSIVTWGIQLFGGTGGPAGTGFTKIFSNLYSFTALRSDGSVFSWGDVSRGGSNYPKDAGFSRVVSAGNSFAAIKSDGSVSTWGELAGGATGPPPGTGFQNVVITSSGYIGIKPDGTLIASAGVNAPIPVGNGFFEIFTTGISNVALRNDGTLHAWGDPNNGGSGAPIGEGFTTICSAKDQAPWFLGSLQFKIIAAKEIEFQSRIKAISKSIIDYSHQGGATPSVFRVGSASGIISGKAKLDNLDNYTLEIQISNSSGKKIKNFNLRLLDSLAGNQRIGNGSTRDSGSSRQYMNDAAFAVLRANGTVSAWGDAATGGVAPAGLSNVIEVYSTKTAFAALKADGTVVAWGLAGNGGIAPAGLSNVARIFSTASAFAALKKDGTIVVWGDGAAGGAIPAGANLANVREIFSNRGAFAAVKQDGTVISWGNAAEGGNLATPLANVATIVSTWTAFAALRTDGTAFAWGSQAEGGNLPDGYLTGTVARIFSSRAAFVALKTDGTVQGWGDGGHGSVPPSGLAGVADIVGAERAFAALKSDGTVVAWGDSRYGGSGVPAGLANVQALYSNSYAFAALRTDGTVVPWGLNTAGGSTSSASIGGNVVRIYTTERAFAALKSNGTVFAWGDAGYGGSGMPAGLANVDQVLGNPVAFAVLRTDGTLAAWGNAARGGGATPTPGDHLAMQGVVIGRPWFAPGMATTLTALSGTDQAFSLAARGLDLRHSVSAGALPNGMVLDAATGALTGKPTATGNFAFTLQAENGIGRRVLDFLVVVNQAPTITSADKATFTVGTSGSFTATATGFPAPTFSIAPRSLPSGVTLSASGVLSGTPAAGTGGTYAVTLKAANGVGTDATQAFTLTVNQAPAITSADKATFTTGTVGSFTATATGFPSPKFSIASGTLPAGVTLSATGSLAGTPEAGTGGIWPITIKATNGVGSDVTQSFNLTVNQAPAITSSGKASFVVAQTGSFQMTASGYPAPSFAKTSGVLPDGVTLSTSGTLSGKPVAGSAGTYQFEVKASNGTAPDATQVFTLTVNLEGTINFTSQDRASFVEGESGTFQVQADGSPSPNYNLDSGTLPSGVTLSANGVLSGTPTAGTSGIHSFVIRATNGVNADATQVFTLTVNQVPAITSLDKTTFVTGEAGTFTAKATGFPAPVFSLVSGTLPSGVSLSSSGLLSGTPPSGTGGSYFFTLKASNGVGSGVTQSFTLTVNQAAAITSDNKVTFTTGAAGSFTAVATGYPVPVFSVASGTLPTGVTLSSGGVLSGTPADGTGGTYLITIKAANGVGTDATQSFTLTVNQAPAITSASEATFRSGQTGSFNLVASGFPKPKFSILSGSLPNGVTMGADGRIQGTPDGGAGGVYSITMSASNGAAPDASQAFTLTVQESPVIFGRNSRSFRAGVNSSYWFTSFGFPAPVFTVQGTLPAGVTLSTNGMLAGTPPASAQGVYPITILASNGLAPDASKDLILTVTNAPTITSADTVVFRVGDGKSFQMTATGTPLPSFTKAGNLPQGVSFASSGLLSGTPAAGTSGIYPLFVTASNGVNPDDTQGFTLVVQDAPVINSPNSTTFTVGQAGGFQLTAAGYPVPAYTVISGTLPAGISLTAGGLLSGTPAASTGGTYRFTVQATNGVGTDATQAFTLTVNQAPSFTSNLSTTFTTATAGSFQASASGYPSPVFALGSGILPSGVTLSAGGLLSGTPTAQSGGSYPVILKASNGTSPDASQAFTLTVNQPPAITSGNSTTFTVGQAGIYDIVATGFPAPAFTIITGSLPDGVTLALGGALSGTPANGTGGTYRFTVQAANGIGTNATQPFTLTVNQGLAITSPNATTFAVGQSGSFLMTGTGNPAPVFNIASGLLPAGLSFNSNGTLSGTPLTSTGGSYPLVIRASNSIGGEVTQTFTLTVNQAPVITSVSKASF